MRDIELVLSPDAVLIKNWKIVASNNRVVLDDCSKWVNLAAEIIKAKLPNTQIIDLSA